MIVCMFTKLVVVLVLSGEDVVRPIAVDAGRLRRRLEDDPDGVGDARHVAQRRQQQRDEELRLQKSSFRKITS